MNRLAVVTCQILELEFAHILSNDTDITETWVVYDDFSKELTRLLEKDRTQRVYRINAAEGFATEKTDGITVLVQVMEVGLHTNIPILRRGVLSVVEKIAPLVDAVLLGYGLCGNAFNPEEFPFKDIPVPVMLPLDAEGPVDDCVGLIIGGRDNYYAEQCRCAGTMFMNAGFSRHWETILSRVPEKLMDQKERILKRLMGDYKRSLLLPTPVLSETQMRQNTEKFSEKYNLYTETRPGTLALLESAWQKAKQAVLKNRSRW